MPSGSAFVRGSGIRERERAVDRDADRARVEQAPQFGKLRAVRADLSARDRDAQLRGLFLVDVPGEYGELGAAALERAVECRRAMPCLLALLGLMGVASLWLRRRREVPP
nr:hypothetical protein [Frankia sp. QA3]